MNNYKNSRKSRKKAGALLALLGVMSFGSNSEITKADKNSSYVDSVNKIHDININKNNKFKNIENLSQANSVSENAVKVIEDISCSVESVINSGENFIESANFLLPESSWLARFFELKSFKNAVCSTELGILNAIENMKDFINKFKNSKKIFENLYKFSFYSYSYIENTEFEEITNKINLLNNNFDDLKSKLEYFNNKFEKISNLDNLSEKYDELIFFYEELSSPINITDFILSDLKDINNNLKNIKYEFENLPGEYNNYLNIKKSKQVKKLEELKNNFENKKIKIKNKLNKIQDFLSENYKNIWTNIEPDISILVQENFDSKFHELENEIFNLINKISSLEKYTDESTKEFFDIKQKKEDLYKKSQEFLTEVDTYKNKLNIKKENLKEKKAELIKQVNYLQNELDKVWEVQCGNLKEKKDLDKFIEIAKPSYNAAKRLCDQLLLETKNISINININQSDFNQNFKNINKKKLEIKSAINAVREKGLLMRINISKEFINNLIKERDNTWKDYMQKFSPKALNNEFLIKKYREIWENANLDYNETVEWEKNNLNIIKNQELTEDLAENIESNGINFANLLSKFKSKMLIAREKMNDLVVQIQADLAKQNAWNRVFTTTGNYENVKIEAGDNYVNKTYKHSQALAELIDSYLPGTYNNILKLCNKMRQKLEFVLISGDSGWGKTQSVNYLINATRAQKISINYKKLIESVDGAQYAIDLLSKYKNKPEPLIMVLDEFDIVAKPRNDGGNTAGIINSFFEKIKEISEDPSSKINLKLVICISNMNKNQLDPANVNRMTSYLTYNINPDYKKIISVISSGIECSAIDGNKENFVNKIAQTCSSLAINNSPPSPGNIVKAIYTVILDECARINSDKQEGDEDYINLWHVSINSEKVSEKIAELTPKQRF